MRYSLAMKSATPFQEEAMSLLLPLKYCNRVMPSDGGQGSSLPNLGASILNWLARFRSEMQEI